jgi:hypothetical protein
MRLAVVACGPVLVLFPFFDGGVRDLKPKYFSKLGHGKNRALANTQQAE